MEDPPHLHRKQLHRIEQTHDLRFLTFSTYDRLPLFLNDRIRDLFATHLEAARVAFSFNLYAWVVMPEHIHLLLWPLLPEHPVSALLSQLKRGFARQVVERWREIRASVLPRLTMPDGSIRFWQRGGGYDRNIFSSEETSEKLNYIHQNPVTRGLVTRPQDWVWSSARWYAGDRAGPVQIDSLPPKRPLLRTPPQPDAT